MMGKGTKEKVLLSVSAVRFDYESIRYVVTCLAQGT